MAPALSGVLSEHGLQRVHERLGIGIVGMGGRHHSTQRREKRQGGDG
jgi:hypothetical protein